MSVLLNCGIFCMLISSWGVLQLFFMGIFYYLESIVLLEDVEAEEYDDYDDFIKKTTNNFKSLAINCWISAAIYVLFLGISYSCILKARKKAKLEALKQADDEYTCTPKELPKKKPQAIK